MENAMRHVDLCSGIGGFALGFQWAELSEPVLFCDIEDWSRQVIRKHWPGVPIAKDVKELANDPERLVPDCDIITAGYPCQPFSLAGKRKGQEDDRHIWPHILRIVAQKRPTWCVFENVYGHLSMGLDQVLLDLESEGYATRTFIVPAAGVNAPHKRDRIWIVGYTENIGRNGRAETAGREGEKDKPEQSESEVWCEPSRPGEDVAYTDNARREEQRGSFTAQKKHKASECRSWWESEPNVGRVANGIPRRVDRLKGLGNAIVPQIAMQIGKAIKAQ